MYKLVALVALIVFSCIASADSGVVITADGYTFHVSTEWSRVGKAEEREVRNVMAKSNQGYAELNDNFFVFNTPEDYMIVIYDVIYKGERPSLKTRLERSKQSFQIGVSNGIVKTILSNKIVVAGKINVLEMDWVGNSRKKNNRNLLYTAHMPNEKVSVNISAFFPDDDARFKDQVRAILTSIGFKP